MTIAPNAMLLVVNKKPAKLLIIQQGVSRKTFKSTVCMTWKYPYGCKPIKWLHSSLLNNNFMFVAHNSPESNLSCYQYVKLETMNLALGHIGPYMMRLNYFYNPGVTYKFRCVCHRHTYRCMLNTHKKRNRMLSLFQLMAEDLDCRVQVTYPMPRNCRGIKKMICIKTLMPL